MERDGTLTKEEAAGRWEWEEEARGRSSEEEEEEQQRREVAIAACFVATKWNAG